MNAPEAVVFLYAFVIVGGIALWSVISYWWHIDDLADSTDDETHTETMRDRLADDSTPLRDWKVTCTCGAEYTPKAMDEPTICYECGSTSIDTRLVDDKQEAPSR